MLALVAGWMTNPRYLVSSPDVDTVVLEVIAFFVFWFLFFVSKILLA